MLRLLLSPWMARSVAGLVDFRDCLRALRGRQRGRRPDPGPSGSGRPGESPEGSESITPVAGEQATTPANCEQTEPCGPLPSGGAPPAVLPLRRNPTLSGGRRRVPGARSLLAHQGTCHHRRREGPHPGGRRSPRYGLSTRPPRRLLPSRMSGMRTMPRRGAMTAGCGGSSATSTAPARAARERRLSASTTWSIRSTPATSIRDGMVYSSQVFNTPVGVPLAPRRPPPVQLRLGRPLERLTPISHPVTPYGGVPSAPFPGPARTDSLLIFGRKPSRSSLPPGR